MDNVCYHIKESHCRGIIRLITDLSLHPPLSLSLRFLLHGLGLRVSEGEARGCGSCRRWYVHTRLPLAFCDSGHQFPMHPSKSRSMRWSGLSHLSVSETDSLSELPLPLQWQQRSASVKMLMTSTTMATTFLHDNNVSQARMSGELWSGGYSYSYIDQLTLH